MTNNYYYSFASWKRSKKGRSIWNHQWHANKRHKK